MEESEFLGIFRKVRKQDRLSRSRIHSLAKRKGKSKISQKERDALTKIKNLHESDFAFLKIKGIKKIKPTSMHVYDFSVEGYENFVGGVGGVFLHNSFAVGRAQEIMAILGSNPNLGYPVYMEGMLWDATAIHTAYPEYLSNYLQRGIFKYGKNPFLSSIFHRVAPKEREGIIDSAEPAIIIATSGMLIGGPAVEYLKGLAPNKKNTLLFVGYQAEGTLGRRIQKGWREIPLKDAGGRTQRLPIEMNVETIHGLTGHSGRNQLINYVRRLHSRPERIIIDHGESRKCTELARDLHKICRCETLAPKNMETIRLK